MSNPQKKSSGPRRVKIFGERNSGTTWLDALLTRNLMVHCLPGGVPRWVHDRLPDREFVRDGYFRATRRRNLGWKHAIAPDAKQLAAAHVDPDDVLFVTLTKNPYAWLLSLHRRPYHTRQKLESFAAFISTPWPTVDRENAPARFETPVAMWNAKNESYLRLADRTATANTRYEDWLADPIGRLEGLCRDGGLRRRRIPFENVEEAIKREDRSRRFTSYQDYYLKEAWREELDPEDLTWINERLDPELMAHFGYARIEPGD